MEEEEKEVGRKERMMESSVWSPASRTDRSGTERRRRRRRRGGRGRGSGTEKAIQYVLNGERKECCTLVQEWPLSRHIFLVACTQLYNHYVGPSVHRLVRLSVRPKSLPFFRHLELKGDQI